MPNGQSDSHDAQGQPEILSYLRHRRLTLEGNINDFLVEPRPTGSKHGQQTSTSTSSLGQGVKKTRSRPVLGGNRNFCSELNALSEWSSNNQTFANLYIVWS